MFRTLLAMLLMPFLIVGFAILFVGYLITSTDWKALWRGEE